MRTFYFVGGPVAEQREQFLQRLNEIGGSPRGWRIYPHANGDGRALHIVDAESEASIDAHLAAFDGIYERGPIAEVRDTAEEAIVHPARAGQRGRKTA